jgi:ATP phosphoribosyltransferase
MLTLALPKSRLLSSVTTVFEANGVPLGQAVEAAGRSLVLEVSGMRVLLLKDPDVPVYVEQGVAHCGVVGLDHILEREVDVLRLLRLPFQHCRLCLIAREGKLEKRKGRQLLIASKYPRLAAREAAHRGIRASIIALAGSVELAASLGLADAVVDLVETGRTLRENGLHPVEEWLRIAPYLIANRAAFTMERNEIRALRRTLGGRQ